jgi:hypothetical protein
MQLELAPNESCRVSTLPPTMTPFEAYIGTSAGVRATSTQLFPS